MTTAAVVLAAGVGLMIASLVATVHALAVYERANQLHRRAKRLFAEARFDLDEAQRLHGEARLDLDEARRLHGEATR